MLWMLLHGKPTFLGNDISTWDFSTLYTSTPHDKLKIRIYELLELVFTTVNRRYIAVRYNSVLWTDDNTKNKGYYFTCRRLSNAIDYLINYIFIYFGSNVFKQVITVPMGTNCAPLLADLFLHTYEYNFFL